MTRRQKLTVTLACVILVAIVTTVAYYFLFYTPATKQPPFDNLHLGMSSADATKLIGREGKPCDHDKLPRIPLPRQLFKAIPEATAWFVWWDEKTGVAALTLGVLEGRV